MGQPQGSLASEGWAQGAGAPHPDPTPRPHGLLSEAGPNNSAGLGLSLGPRPRVRRGLLGGQRLLHLCSGLYFQPLCDLVVRCLSAIICCIWFDPLPTGRLSKILGCG